MSPGITLWLCRVLAAMVFSLCLIPASVFADKGSKIRLPVDISSNSSPISLTGFSGYNRGEYEGGEFRGTFTRIESRLGVFDPLYVVNREKSGFTIEDPTSQVLIEAKCNTLKRTVGIRFVELDLTKFTYNCDFNGQEAVGEMRLVLGEPKRRGLRERLMARESRAGEALVLDRNLRFESVHEYEGSNFDSQTPLGYLIKEDGIVVAAVDLLDWNPVVYLHDSLTEAGRKAAMIVALSLAVLRDPANSALEDMADMED